MSRAAARRRAARLHARLVCILEALGSRGERLVTAPVARPRGRQYGKVHPWSQSPNRPSRAAREAHEEVERRRIVAEKARAQARAASEALAHTAGAVELLEALQPIEHDPLADVVTVAAVLASATPRRISLDAD